MSTITAARREAIGRARRAAARLAIDAADAQLTRRQERIVNEPDLFTDREAWDAVAALEDMVLSRGLVSVQQIEVERRAAAVAVLMGEEVAR